MQKTTDITAALSSATRPAAVLNDAPRIADLRFDRQKELEMCIEADPFTRELVDNYTAAKDYQREDLALHGFVLPQVGNHAWLEGLELVRQRLRLSIPTRVIVILDGNLIGKRVVGIRHEGGIDLFTPQDLLGDANPTELAYHFALGIWYAFEEKYHSYREVLRRNCPNAWEVKDQMLEWMRYTQYAASCYASLACGDPDTAIAETWRQCLGQRGIHDSKGLLALSQQHAQAGHMPPLMLFKNFLETGTYLVGLPKVLQAFHDSATCHTLLGKKGGTSREQFQGQVKKLDEALYSEPWEMDEDFVSFMIQSSLFTRAYILEASSEYSLEALADSMDNDAFDREGLIQFAESLGLGADRGEDALPKLLKRIKEAPHAWMLPLFAHEILMGCFTIIIQESAMDAQFGSKVEDRMDLVMELCGVNDAFGQMLFASIVASMEASD